VAFQDLFIDQIESIYEINRNQSIFQKDFEAALQKKMKYEIQKN